jgi:hypothetical protein
MQALRNPYARSLVLVWLSACGDDGGAEETEVQRDASAVTASDASLASDAGGARDGAAPALDAGVNTMREAAVAPAEAAVAGDAALGDASSELLQALDRAGLRTDVRRAELVFEALCRHDVTCGLRDDLEGCLNEQVANAGFVLFGDEDCIDATLDQQACYATIACDDPDPCSEGLVTAFMACATFTEAEAQP